MTDTVDQMRLIEHHHPPCHAKHLVHRDGFLFTATPCYGMHEPWWVVMTMEGEVRPVPFRDSDRWMEIDAAIAVLLRETASVPASAGETLKAEE